MRSRNGIAGVCLAATIGLLSGPSCGLNDTAISAEKDGAEKLDPEFAALQGQWERKFKSENGNEFRMLKEIRGTRETVAVFRVKDEKEALVARWHVTFTVNKTDRVRVFTWINMVYTDGPLKGRKSAGPFSYIYQVRGDYLITASGVLNTDKQRPSMDIFRRVKPEI